MKAKLLQKCRKRVQILNKYGDIADKNDKFITVVIADIWENTPMKNSKGDTHYINYGNAVIKRRAVILEEAKRIFERHLLKKSKNWLYNVFH